MGSYNLTAEFSALLIVLIVLLSFKRDYEEKNVRFQVLKLMYFGTLLSIFATITSTLLTDGYSPFFPVVLGYFTTLLYFVTAPMGAYFYFLYSISMTTFYMDKKNAKVFRIASIPYGIYILLIIANIFTGDVFSITTEEGYIRGDWYQITYVIAIVHVLLTIFVAIRNLHRLYKDAKWILLLNLVLVISLSGVQFFMENILISGLAGVTGVLVVHLYIQNVSKSTDKLTELRNRNTCTYMINEHIKKKKEFSLYIISTRNFKDINANKGIDYGDRTLKKMATYFLDYFSTKEVFRYSGDEFAILVDDKTDRLEGKIKEILLGLEKGIEVDKEKQSIEAICARVDYPEFGKSSQELISAADYSLQLVKESLSQRNYIHEIGALVEMKEKNETRQGIKDAIKEKSFVIHYQPIYNMKEGTFTKAEALVRMKNNEDGSLIYPNKFIDMAESTGTIVDLTYIVLEKTCADFRRLLDKNNENLKLSSISVNFSYLQFLDENVTEKVMAILEKYKIETSMIKIEITERVFAEDLSKANNIVNKMKEKGFVFELDDFGIDYSSLNMIFDIPAEIIKIDRTLLLLATESEKNKIFFKNLIVGMMSAGKKIVVEGAETEEHIDFVKECGCDFVQGYYLSKPKDFDNLEKFLLENAVQNYKVH